MFAVILIIEFCLTQITTMRTSDSILIRVVRMLHLNRLYRSIENSLPAWANSKIQEVTLKNVFIPLVDEKEVIPQFKKALEFLLNTVGTDGMGDYLEFGVSYGTSLSCMHKVQHDLGLKTTRLFGFDSFQGMPESASSEELGKWRPGEFASPIENTKKLLTEHGVDWKRTFLIKGWFNDTLKPETVNQYAIKKASVIMIDCDIYSSARLALNFCLPFIKDSAIIFFDDWFDNEALGEDKAFKEYLTENPQFTSSEFGSYLPTGRSFLITNTALS